MERSGSGAPILRHEPVVRALRMPDLTRPDRRRGIEAHLDTFLGDSPMVWHEIVSDLVHVDVYTWAPTDERPWYTLVTLGMSDLPMTVPPELLAQGAPRRAELMLCLPPSWPVPTPVPGATAASWTDEAYFPVRWLKILARLPHDHRTWLGFSHTVPNGDPPEPFTADTSLCGWLLMSPLTMPDEFDRLEVDGEQVEFFGVFALHADELDRKLADGISSLIPGFERDGVSEILDLARPSSVR
ncbi:MAG: suppressor of fused domain protein [Ilumatobacteraceae bacterium]